MINLQGTCIPLPSQKSTRLPFTTATQELNLSALRKKKTVFANLPVFPFGRCPTMVSFFCTLVGYVVWLHHDFPFLFDLELPNRIKNVMPFDKRILFEFNCVYNGLVGLLFEDWVSEIDRKFEADKRNFILIVDNCHAHPQIGDLKAINLVFFTTKGPRGYLQSESKIPTSGSSEV